MKIPDCERGDVDDESGSDLADVSVSAEGGMVSLNDEMPAIENLRSLDSLEHGVNIADLHCEDRSNDYGKAKRADLTVEILASVPTSRDVCYALI
jgi:hypothetical protein